MQAARANPAHTTTPITPGCAFNNPRAMQPALDLLVTCHDEDLRAILIHGLVEHVMRGSHYAPAGDERRDAIADFGIVVASLEPYDVDGDRRAWLIGVLTAAWIAPRDEVGVASWRLFTMSERRDLWAVVHDAVRRIRTLPRTEGRDQAMYTFIHHIAEVVERMVMATNAADAWDDMAMLNGCLSIREAHLIILPVLLDCYDALHQGDVELSDSAIQSGTDKLLDAVDGLIDSGLLPSDTLSFFRTTAHRDV